MPRKLIDISVPLQNDVPADPPGGHPTIEYIDHQQGLAGMLRFFPGLKAEERFILADMGVHLLDLARFFMGEVERVQTLAGTLAYPELKTVGDIDNAVVSLRFSSGMLGAVDLSRNGIYGYDIQSELLGTEGTLRIGYLRETPLFVMKKNSISHDTVPYFMERFAQAYTAQLQNFAQNVLQQRPAPITIDDGLAAIQIAVAALRSHETGQPTAVA